MSRSDDASTVRGVAKLRKRNMRSWLRSASASSPNDAGRLSGISARGGRRSISSVMHLLSNARSVNSPRVVTILGPKTWNALVSYSFCGVGSLRSTGKPRALPLLRIFTISARSSENRKSPSSMTSVPRHASRIRKSGETVEAPLAKIAL